MMQRPSLSHPIPVRYFFFAIMSVMIIKSFCKQKFDVVRWWYRMIHWNACEKFSIFFYIVNKPYKRIFKWLKTYLLITLTWNNRGFGVLGYCMKVWAKLFSRCSGKERGWIYRCKSRKQKSINSMEIWVDSCWYLMIFAVTSQLCGTSTKNKSLRPQWMVIKFPESEG